MFFYGMMFMVGLLALWGCPKKADLTATPEAQKEEQAAASQGSGESNTGGKSAMNTSIDKQSQERAASSQSGVQPIYFDYDKSNLRTDAIRIMENNVTWLKANPKAKVRIEGNCDERGAVEYNQALGQRRSVVAKKYLTDMGISATRITLISFGKEKPLCGEHTEACMQKNRRDDLVIVNE
jgi:peptidoglycan-associated lipoprotein